jgi:quinol monooxygenase YgiN
LIPGLITYKEITMYGTVARMKVKPGFTEAMERIYGGQEMPAGAVAFYAYQMDADPNELYMVAIFESKEAYVANAQSAESDAQYQQWLEWLDAEPEWHDGEIVYAERAGE